MSLNNEQHQTLWKSLGYYTGDIDGDIGPLSRDAIAAIFRDCGAPDDPECRAEPRSIVAATQLLLMREGCEPGEVDGFAGHNTAAAFEAWQFKQQHGRMPTWRDEQDALPVTAAAPATASQWPLERDCMTFYGDVGGKQQRITLPYPLVLSWEPDTTVTSMKCHERVAGPMRNIFQQTLAHFGHDRIKELRLDNFGGCLNVRKKRNGSSWSMHSWGIAVDLDPENNRLKWGADRASFARPEYAPFWNIVEANGAVSLGRARNFDWMHFQFARVS